MSSWPDDFPRLYDLYKRSDGTHPDNYFTKISAHIGDELWQRFFGWIESHLARLDGTAWEQLVARTLPYVCRKDRRRGWSQFWDHLNEAFGYVLLADRGFTGIHFIDKKDDKTPDLLGGREGSRAVVEVKTINNSEEDLDMLDTRQPVARDVMFGLSAEFKEKLEKTIDNAERQLLAFCSPSDKKIVLLVITLDTDWKFVSQNYQELVEFILEQQRSQVEIVHQLYN